MIKKENIKNNLFRIIISGGGTGGHIFPAIAIANALKEIDSNIEILFVGALNRMEMQKIPAAGYKIVGLPVAGLQRKLTFKNFTFIFKLIASLLKARKVIKDFNPQLVVGVGGFASGPVLWMASSKGIPTVIQEQNSYAGLTNKLLAKKASKIFVAYYGMEKYFPAKKLVLTGNPVRQDLENGIFLKTEATEYFDLNEDKKVILIIGGSLGARTLNQSIALNLEVINKSNVQIIWQCGPVYYSEAKKLIENNPNRNIKLFDFIARMDLAYTVADLVISRAGASSISELCIVAKPAILVPSPNVAEDHQTKNALALVEKNAAILIKDNEAHNFLIEKALELVDNKDRCKILSENIAKLALHNSAKRIAAEIIEMIKIKNSIQ